jgi:type VI secretion system protein ImpJ
MSLHNRIVWHEGLFIRPQHFQQQERHWEYQLHNRFHAVDNFGFGLLQLLISQEHLQIGQIALIQGSVLFADGSFCRFPDEDSLPAALTIPATTRPNQRIFLALTLNTPGSVFQSTERYQQHQRPIADLHSPGHSDIEITLHRLHPCLQLEEQPETGYTRIPIARLLGHRADGALILDPDFMPCGLAVHAIAPLQRALFEICGLVSERANSLSQRVAAPRQQEIAEWHDFLLLQLLHRQQALLDHLRQLPNLHPERLFSALIQLHAELATLMAEQNRPASLPAYQHSDPGSCFIPLLNALRQALGTLVAPRVLALPLQLQPFGLRVAALHEARELGPVDLILAVKAHLPLEQLRLQFPQQSKVAHPEQIRELIALQLPGVPLLALPVVPRHLPYHAGFSYFQLDQQHPDWSRLATGTQLAIHVAGEFPGLELQLWAIRG